MKTKLDVKACAAASAVLWSGTVFTVAVVSTFRPRYGKEFLQLVSSIYPGYKARRTLGQAAIGASYAALDGAAGGALFALLYNRFAR
jgi:hypothetical protein